MRKLAVLSIFFFSDKAAHIRLVPVAPFLQENSFTLLLDGHQAVSEANYGEFSLYTPVNEGSFNATVVNTQFLSLAPSLPITLFQDTFYSLIFFQRYSYSSPELFLYVENRSLSPPDYTQATAKFVYYYFLPNVSEAAELYVTSSECVNCLHTPVANLSANSVMEVPWDSDYSLQWEIANLSFQLEVAARSITSVLVCAAPYSLKGTWTLSTDLQADSPYVPLVVAGAIFFILTVIFYTAQRAWKNREFLCPSLDRYQGLPSLPEGDENEDVQKPKERLGSLDTFRGLSLAIMVFVNAGGGGYGFFDHAMWNGLTIADLVFPWFIFMMGCSMALSFRGLMRPETPRNQILLKVTQRAITLFAIGLFLANGAYPQTWRIMGVLQRFGVSYFVVALIILFVPATLHTKTSPVGIWADLRPFWMQWCVVGLFGVVWVLITFLLPVPGCPTGYLGAGGVYGDQGSFPQCTGGAAAYIDQQVLGSAHLYQHPTCQTIYGTGAYDPEGILGCLTSVIITFLGYHAGRIVVSHKTPTGRLLRWSVFGVVLCLMGGALCGFSKENGIIPINKNLWSLSFVFVMAGTGYLMLSLMYVLVDLYKVWPGTPFLFVGMNSITIYLVSSILHNYFPFTIHIYGDVTYAKTLTQSLMAVVTSIFVAYVLFSKQIFISI